MAEQEIPEQLLTQMLLEQVPEYYGSKEKYQPADVGSMIANMSLLEDRLGLMADPLMAILAGTFDYNTLIGESDFDEKAPDSAQADWYRSTGLYPELFHALDSGLTPSEAALQQYASEGMPDITEQLQKGDSVDPRYNDLKSIAEKSAEQIAARSGWEQRRDSAGYAKSETGKMLEEMGMSSRAYTPDKYFSDSIAQLRQDRDEGQAGMQDVRTYDDATAKLEAELSALATQGYANKRGADIESQRQVPTTADRLQEDAGESSPDVSMGGGNWSDSRIATGLDMLSKGPASGFMGSIVSPWTDMIGLDDAQDWFVDRMGESLSHWGGEVADSARQWGGILGAGGGGNPYGDDLAYVLTGERPSEGPGSNSMGGGKPSTNADNNLKARQRGLRKQIAARDDRTEDFNKAYDKHLDSSTGAYHERRAIERERKSGRTQQRDQAMTLASYLLRGQ